MVVFSFFIGSYLLDQLFEHKAEAGKFKAAPRPEATPHR